MKEIIVEMEVDEMSQVIELPVSESNIIELDFTHLDAELDEEFYGAESTFPHIVGPATDQNPDSDENDDDHDDYEDPSDMDNELDIE